MVPDQPPEFGEVTDAVDPIAKGRECRCEFGEIAACACQASQRGRSSVNPEFLFDKIQQDAAALGERRWRNLAPALGERPGLPDRGISAKSRSFHPGGRDRHIRQRHSRA